MPGFGEPFVQSLLATKEQNLNEAMSLADLVLRQEADKRAGAMGAVQQDYYKALTKDIGERSQREADELAYRQAKLEADKAQAAAEATEARRKLAIDNYTRLLNVMPTYRAAATAALGMAGIDPMEGSSLLKALGEGLAQGANQAKQEEYAAKVAPLNQQYATDMAAYQAELQKAQAGGMARAQEGLTGAMMMGLGPLGVADTALRMGKFTPPAAPTAPALTPPAAVTGDEALDQLTEPAKQARVDAALAAARTEKATQEANAIGGTINKLRESATALNNARVKGLAEAARHNRVMESLGAKRVALTAESLRIARSRAAGGGASDTRFNKLLQDFLITARGESTRTETEATEAQRLVSRVKSELVTAEAQELSIRSSPNFSRMEETNPAALPLLQARVAALRPQLADAEADATAARARASAARAELDSVQGMRWQYSAPGAQPSYRPPFKQPGKSAAKPSSVRAIGALSK